MDADVRLKQLLGEENVQKISALKVAVIGLGGVGGYAVETLARSFVGTLYLVDFDVVDMSNINRQIIALHSTVGKKKSFLWKERILDINPGCDVRIIDCFLEKENMDVLFSHSIDYVVDACDTLETKMELIRFCEQKKIKLISCMGTALKNNPEMLKIMDIRKTSYDPIAKQVRKMVNTEKIGMKIPVVCSCEQREKKKELGSGVFVPATAGILCANYVIRDWIGEL